MSSAVIQNHQAIFSPPLALPLRLRGRSGLFGMNRTRLEETYTWTAGHGGPVEVTYRPHQTHTGLDLQANLHDPVFAARSGELVEINEINGDMNDRRMFIRHMDQGAPSFITRYLHVKDPKINVGDRVVEGHCIAEIGRPRDPHLHFEICLIINTNSVNDWWIRNTEALDPIPFLYRWEKIHFEQIEGIRPPFGSRGLLDFAGVVRKSGISFLEVEHNGDWFYVPLNYGDQHEAGIVEMLASAFNSRSAVRISAWQSPFFGGRKIIRQVRVGGSL